MVVDASVALKWFVEEEGSQAARRLIASPISAPDLITPELTNAFWSAANKGRFDPADLPDALSLFDAVVAQRPCRALAPVAVEMALAMRHPVYDCFYLAAAVDAGSVVVTTDRRFHRAASASIWSAHVVLLEAD